MRDTDSRSSGRVHVVIPALNEAGALPGVLAGLAAAGVPDLDNIIVVDNGSRDGTGLVALRGGAVVVRELSRGYGAACLAGIATLQGRPDHDIVVFCDADGSDDPSVVPPMVAAIRAARADLVLASRTLVGGEPGALTLAQLAGNRLACALIARLWKVRYTDLAPCRAIRLGALRSLGLGERAHGWTVEMQVRAARRGLRIAELATVYRRRRQGASKISGTLRGTVLAGCRILAVIAREYLGRSAAVGR